ncbi:MAG TPA: hypothetical protein VGI81_25265 [Tepidisphaeraceae bacterium]|jgi:hypothetical protein
MIQNDEQLLTVKQQLERVESALHSLKQRLLPQSEATFRLMAEGYIDQIAALRREIDEYLGIATRTARAEGSATVGGVIRQIDLDENTFRLSDPTLKARDLTCEFDELAEEDVRALVGQPVRVTGTLRASGKTGQQTMEADKVELNAR